MGVKFIEDSSFGSRRYLSKSLSPDLSTDAFSDAPECSADEPGADVVEQVVLGQGGHFHVDIDIVDARDIGTRVGLIDAGGFFGHVADKHVSLIGAFTRDFGFGDLGAKVGGKIDFFALVVDGICVGNIVGDGAVSKGSYVECLVEQGNSGSVKNEISDKHNNS